MLFIWLEHPPATSTHTTTPLRENFRPVPGMTMIEDRIKDSLKDNLNRNVKDKVKDNIEDKVKDNI